MGVELACVSAAECHLDMAAAVYHVRRADTLRHTMVGAERMAFRRGVNRAGRGELVRVPVTEWKCKFRQWCSVSEAFPLVRNSVRLLLAVLSRT